MRDSENNDKNRLSLRYFFPIPLLFSVTAVGFLFFAPAWQHEAAANRSTGKRLALLHCAGCHRYPKPELFERTHWDQQILPRMAWFMGIYPTDSLKNALRADDPQTFPEQPMLSTADFQAIRDFYLQNALEQGPQPKKMSIQSNLPGFAVQKPQSRIIPPGVSMVRFGINGELYIGDAYARKLFLYDSALQLQRSGLIGEGIADLRQRSDTLWLTVMGSFSPTEAKSGYLLRMNARTGQGIVIADRLQRPVATTFGDLDGDGREDAVICEFGRYTGRLAWWSANADTMQPHLLMSKPGATKVRARDLDGDGDLDIAALFGQADEGIWLFFNDGKGNFTTKNILRFDAANGSSSFDFCDFNRDGFPDILYTCGDNADFKPVLKPWHGVYIFLNDGKNNFKQHFFQPLPGAYQALARDFDLDGDLDIAVVAFFPDFEKQPETGFVLLQQNEPRQFQAFTFPESMEGRWMVMDAGDSDGDGDLDLALGSMTFAVAGRPDLAEGWKNGGLPFVVLKNTVR